MGLEQKLAQLRILKTGPGTTIQDLGRSKSAEFGVPQSGAADEISARWVNHILQNSEGSALLEICQPGFKVAFEVNTRVAWAGAKVDVFLNGERLNPIQQLQASTHDLLEFGRFEKGAKLYLGVSGGFNRPEILGSKSYFQGITNDSYLKIGDLIPYFLVDNPSPSRFSTVRWSFDWFETECLEFYPGPDYDLLDKTAQEKLLTEEFTISALSSRMGIILEEVLENQLPELPTNPVFPGFVQLTSGGKLILLGPDAQVTGGYPRIMILSEIAQSILAQKKPGQKIRFRKIDITT